MLSEKTRKEILDFIHLTFPDTFVVALDFKQGKQSLLAIKVDTDSGISLEYCTKISRAVGYWLEDKPWMDMSYRLEVSSPGIGYPLQLKRQYPQNIGRFLRVKMKDGKQHEGKLLEVKEDSIVLEPNSGSPKGKKNKNKPKPKEEAPQLIRIGFEEIKESKVVIYF